MPARKQKRQVARRRRGEGEATANQKPKSRCEVCSKIAAVFLIASHRREGRPINFDAIDSSNRIHGELGTVEDVIRNSTCKFHPQMFLSLFQNEVNRNGRGKQEVFCGASYSSPAIFTGLRRSGNPEGVIWISELVLVPSKCRVPNLHRGRILDAKYIDTNLLRRWRRSCDIQRHSACQHNPIQHLLSRTPPAYLIDTWSMCLVQGYADASYVALSYVWGKDPFFQATKVNIEELQVKNALGDSPVKMGLPRTISDAISVVPFLGERYLWVDALCIVQDDKEMKHDQVKYMVSIFANASITIMAHQGEDANYGLRGLRGISLPRQLSQQQFELENGYKIIQLREPKQNHTWFQRGWTFQEGLFSRRKLTFNNDAIFWDCHCSSLKEDLEPQPEMLRPRANYYYPHFRDFKLTTSIPNLRGYTKCVNIYNCRELTFQEDAMAAFSGIVTVASRSFQGGFICGLPILFFDTALCWQPANAHSKRRYPSKNSDSQQILLPSWSWVGWQGRLQQYCWNDACHYVKHSPSLLPCMTSTRTVSTVQWYSRQSDTTNLNPILGPQIVQARKVLAQESDYVLEPGWKRFRYMRQPASWTNVSWPDLLRPKYYFKHESDPETELWYPLPIGEEQQQKHHYLQTEDTILCCHTQKSKLRLAENIPTSELVFALRKDDGAWAGVLQLNVKPLVSRGSSKRKSSASDGTLCELVVISEGYFLEGSYTMNMNEYGIAARPKAADGARYEFYNVLWVEWEEGIAYRKGCGRVAKELWDSLNPVWFDLVLG